MELKNLIKNTDNLVLRCANCTHYKHMYNSLFYHNIGTDFACLLNKPNWYATEPNDVCDDFKPLIIETEKIK